MQRTLTERQFRTPGGAEQVGRQAELRAAHVREQQRGTARRDHAAMDLGNLEVRIDRRFHGDDVVVVVETVDELTKVLEHLRFVMDDR